MQISITKLDGAQKIGILVSVMFRDELKILMFLSLSLFQ